MMHPGRMRQSRCARCTGDRQLTEARSNILQLAREMAESGLYRGWRSIEGRLRADGLPRIREVFDDEIKYELDHRCKALRSHR